MDLFIKSLLASIKITSIIFVLMFIVELLVLKYQAKIVAFVKKNTFLSYLVSVFFGIIPGCVGTFVIDSLYMSGLISFGGIVAVMIATSGDEAFLMIAMATRGEISWTVLIYLVLILFVLGLIGAFLADYLKKKLNFKFCRKCKIIYHEIDEFKPKHFLKEHVYGHIIKKHIWQIFLWIFFAIYVINLVGGMINIETVFNSANLVYVLLIAALLGVLPISGPNIFLLVLFSKGLIPFSILLANSIIQDGHGLLPIMGFSMDDAVRIKLFNFIFGLLIGGALLFFGF
jgi:hypothetical protein